jgi:hypothetical protein
MYDSEKLYGNRFQGVWRFEYVVSLKLNVTSWRPQKWINNKYTYIRILKTVDVLLKKIEIKNV